MSGDTLVALIGIVALMSFGVWTALRPRLAARRLASRWPSRPLPEVTPNDEERVARRDFPADQLEGVMALLREYTSQWGEEDSTSVRIAALRLADGNLDLLREVIAAAKQDYRDVLVAAQHPEYSKAISGVRKLSKRERQRIVDADWNQCVGLVAEAELFSGGPA